MPNLPLDRLDGVVFDTDGVLTDTAGVHAAAWAGLFDGYLARRAARLGGPWRPFTQADYLTPERLRVQHPPGPDRGRRPPRGTHPRQHPGVPAVGPGTAGPFGP